MKTKKFSHTFEHLQLCRNVPIISKSSINGFNDSQIQFKLVQFIFKAFSYLLASLSSYLIVNPYHRISIRIMFILFNSTKFLTQYWLKSGRTDMRIPNVDKFLFCMKLETGGTILGWFTAIVASFLLLSNLLAFGASVFSYDALLNSTSMDPEQKHSMENFQWSEWCNRMTQSTIN